MQLQNIDATISCPSTRKAGRHPRSLPSVPTQGEDAARSLAGWSAKSAEAAAGVAEPQYGALLNAATEYAFGTDSGLMLFDANAGGAPLVWARPRRTDWRGPVGLLKRFGPRGWRRFCALAVGTLLAACGGGGSDGNTTKAFSTGVPVTMMLTESAPLAPAMVDGTCVVFTPILSAEESSHYLAEAVRHVFEHIGESIRTCMDGDALSYLGTLPASHFFQDTLFINLDGTCPAGSSGCYWPGNPTVDRAQTHWPTDPVAADKLLSGLVGHEVWHAVAGFYHR